MKPKTLKILLAILVSSAVLAVTVKIINKPKPPKKLAGVGIIKSAKYLEIKNALEHYKFAKSNPNWHMISPFNYKADKDKIEELIYALPLVTVSQVITKNEKTFSNYGLAEKDRVKVKISDGYNDTLADFIAGKQSDFSSFYLYDEKCNGARQGDGLNISFLKQPFNNWLDKTMFEENVENIIYVALEEGKKYLKILKEKNEWFFIKNKKTQKRYKISPDKTGKFINPLLNELSYLEAEKVIPANGKYGENINFETHLKIEIGLSDQSVSTIFMISQKNEDDTYFAKKVGNSSVNFQLPQFRIKPFLISYKDLK